MEHFAEFLASTGGLAVKGALVAAFLDFAFGVFAAFRDGTFALDSVAAFVRKHLLGRVFPASLLAYVAWTTGDPIATAAAAGALVAYAGETMSSIYGSLNPPKASDIAPTTEAEVLNPVPVD
jgi:hypothetical protein